jgi:TIR domain
MLEVNPTTANKLNVFISYSRDDLGFADQLEEALKITGFSTALDRHGISGGEDWQARLGALIRDADTVAFVLSPASAKSEICAWEVAEAVRLNKRILPVLPRSLNGQSAPKQLSQFNYIFFYAEPTSPGSGFGTLGRLVIALNTDLDWLREHTRLLQRATERQAGGRLASRLLTGSDIGAAKAWAARRPRGAPEPTELHLDFLRASELEETARDSAEKGHRRCAMRLSPRTHPHAHVPPVPAADTPEGAALVVHRMLAGACLAEGR